MSYLILISFLAYLNGIIVHCLVNSLVTEGFKFIIFSNYEVSYMSSAYSSIGNEFRNIIRLFEILD